MSVEVPLDHLAELWPEKFRGARVGALLHPASVSAKLEHASRILERHNGDLFRLSAFFGPQHGFLGQTQDNMVEWKSYEHPRLHIPVYSLYGEHREPTAEMLKDLDVLLVDLQDVGARYYTFIWTMYLCMRACEKARVADRRPRSAESDQWRNDRGAAARSELQIVRRSPSDSSATRKNHRRTSAAISRRSFPGMSIVDPADEKLGAPDVVRSNRSAMGNAVAQHADARYRDGLSRHVSSRRNEYFRRPRHNASIRNFRRTVYRSRDTLPRAQRIKIARRFLSRKLFSADLSQVRRRTL